MSEREQSIKPNITNKNYSEMNGTPKIKVVGVGGGGCNAVRYMSENDIVGVEFIIINTDNQSLRVTSNSNIDTVQIGQKLTGGLGAGADPSIGESAAEENVEDIRNALKGANMVFITAGMGGGTGTGAAKVVAREAKNLGILSVGVVTKPFPFEGSKRANFAIEGINSIKDFIDSLIIIPNAKLHEVLGGEIKLTDAFDTVNTVLYEAVKGISEIITSTGLVNVDFADVRTVMKDGGPSMMGSGQTKGENRARDAIETAINSPLLDGITFNKAKGILVNITTNYDLTMSEYDTIGNIITNLAHEDATIVIGTINSTDIEKDEIKINIVATGLMETIEKEKPNKSLLGQQSKGLNINKERSDNINQKEKNRDKGNSDLPAFLRK